MWVCRCFSDHRILCQLFTNSAVWSCSLHSMSVDVLLLCDILGNCVLNIAGSTRFEGVGWGGSYTLSVFSWKSPAVHNWVVYWCNCHEVSVMCIKLNPPLTVHVHYHCIVTLLPSCWPVYALCYMYSFCVFKRTLQQKLT